ncbi:hypothetical protein [Streptomyces chartreusis]|uniref:hypothetical protein n=1 Tax=Streptomyces chartreusis TaxID=1969 RepID=UPI0036615791
MTQGNIRSGTRRRVLRRRSWPILSWGGVAFLWSLYLLILLAFLARENYRDLFFMAAALLAATAVLLRIGSCRVVLLPDSVQVENPIRSYRIPYAVVLDVRAAHTGGLEIETRRGAIIRCFAFGGSLLDNFFKTSERAAAEIQSELASKKHREAPGTAGELRRSIRCGWPGYGSLALAVIFVAMGVL